MSKCRYPKVVIKKSIDILEGSNNKSCYKVYIPICGDGDNVLVICRRPHPVGEGFCNKILTRIVKQILRRFEEISSITIIALFPSYEVEDFNIEKNIEKENLKIIRNEIEKASIIISAWGEPYKGIEEAFIERISIIYEYIRESLLKDENRKRIYRIGNLTKKGYPKHYMSWGVNDEIKELIDS